MNMTRRSLLTAAGSLPFAAAASRLLGSEPPRAHTPSHALPAKSEFAPMGVTYLNCGATHPISLGSATAIRSYLAVKSQDRDAPPFRADRDQILAKFAQLINAEPAETCYVPSTTAGETLVIASLNLPAAGGRIVTDALHFWNSFHIYQQLAQRGMEIITLPLKNGTVTVEQYAEAITPNTRLVAFSHVSTLNGHEHDVKRICELAHAQGALVYADMAHAAGSVPVDVRASNVDFAACCTYKWLMGDMGLGFLYVKSSVLPRLQRPWYGHRQIAHTETHLYPYDAPGTTVMDTTLRNDTTGYFEVGFPASHVLAQLSYSLDWILKVGVANIQAYRQPLVDATLATLTKRGFEPLTQPGCRSPLVAFAYRDAARLNPKLDAANVRITVMPNRFRISYSVFNDMNDVDRVVEVLGSAA